MERNTLHLISILSFCKIKQFKIKIEQAASKVKKILEAISGSTMKLLDYTKKEHNTHLTNSKGQSP